MVFVIMEPMFSKKILDAECQKVVITEKQRSAADEWLRKINKNELKSESQNAVSFPKYILEEILGYKEHDIVPEKNKADYQLQNEQKQAVVCLERKGTAKDLTELQSNYPEEKRTPIRQAYDYQSKVNANYSICTNHEIFMLLDKNWMLSKVHEFDFKDIKDSPEKLKEFILVFSKKRLFNSGLYDLHQKTEKEQNDITDEFYKIFHETRLMLIKTFKSNNMSQEDAVNTTQLFLNRLMFFFFASDKGFITGNPNDTELFFNSVKAELKNVKKTTKKVYHYIEEQLFEPLNTGSTDPKIFGFNGGLFRDKMPTSAFFNDLEDDGLFEEIEKELKIDHKTTDRITDLLNSNNEINPIIRNLLIMDSYDFRSEISVNILGHIFEQSVSVLEELTKGTKEKKKFNGVYFTPEYVTEYICNHTIIPYLSKTGTVADTYDLITEYLPDQLDMLEEKLMDIKILDPACGSGAFLIQAAKTLVDIHKAIQDNRRLSGTYLSNKDNMEKLKRWTDESKIKEIIEKNIHGIDISKNSVEIAKLSVFFKIATKNTKLPELGKNILVGDSIFPLVTLDSVQGEFDWETHFGKIIKRGFDVIIGNPPYVRQEHMTNDYKRKIAIPGVTKKTDLSVYFYFRSLEQLKPDGLIGFITSDGWINASYGQSIRNLILKHEIISILRPLFSIFDAQATPIINILKKKKEKNEDSTNLVRMGLIDSVTDLVNDVVIHEINKVQKDMNDESWNEFFTHNPFLPGIPTRTNAELGTSDYGVKLGDDFFKISKEKKQKYNISDKHLVPLLKINKKSSNQDGILSENNHTWYLLSTNKKMVELEKDLEDVGLVEFITKHEKILVYSTRGSDRSVMRIPEIKSIKSNKPWYCLKSKTNMQILISRFVSKRPYVIENIHNHSCTNSNMFYNPKNPKHIKALCGYFKSIFFILELECKASGMGGGVLSIDGGSFKRAIIPDFDYILNGDYEIGTKEEREKCRDEIVQKMATAWNDYTVNFDLEKLDKEILQAMGFTKYGQSAIRKHLQKLQSHREARSKKSKSKK